ncbi:hypothetical protein COV61_05720 [Candidatus Micrarchaeota archaeon CG11_big_fil_rev_8_21_14_0_20_47_5]|nr:MAG: hypothetical protein AUJ17_05585 [Candidatus Micrarchaeota archaeon CG1_02_47_40]PIN82529.1 MAG: hypothetical protein COV61_05720 [Candidatus Micrarchaeota archaeon CG11_big_fil_rev_8_21_14_0_20_47_5]
MQKEYGKLKGKIEKRLKEFRGIGRRGGKRLFPELCFCLLTPQSSARKCDKAVRGIGVSGLHFASAKKIALVLKECGVRFHNNKAGYIICARGTDVGGVIALARKDAKKAREVLVKNVKGLGYKEASHFLRNIGFGENLAILDRHILRNMKREGVISGKEAEKVAGRKKYLELEKKFIALAGKKKIPPSHLDLLFWARETGEIFK